ncbi:cupin domain-containing protein [Methanofollis fontis]|uniref:cupin domain-containing protein n=1 Tax=Methanofollis fontis TaxID=2052832 RepID=UPI002E2766C7
MPSGSEERLMERVIDPLSLVEYQEGAVVSRALVTKRAGTITAFAFDAGQGLSEHTAPYDAILQVLEGTADITVGGRDDHHAGRRPARPAGAGTLQDAAHHDTRIKKKGYEGVGKTPAPGGFSDLTGRPRDTPSLPDDRQPF